MANDLWILVGFGPVLCIGPVVAFAERRRAWKAAARKPFTPPDRNGPAGALDLERTERQLGMLLRRMRAYTRAPYNFASSRIRSDAEFERCLDLATALGLHIGELSGACIAAPRERERMRDQILQGLSPGVSLHRPPRDTGQMTRELKPEAAFASIEAEHPAASAADIVKCPPPVRHANP
jgi:hypothetical protein